MYVQASRYSFNQGLDKPVEIYNAAKAKWAAQPGFHSMSRYRITEGPHVDQQMIVIRFESKEAIIAARQEVRGAEILKALEEAGGKREEVLLLEELP